MAALPGTRPGAVVAPDYIRTQGPQVMPRGPETAQPQVMPKDGVPPQLADMMAQLNARMPNVTAQAQFRPTAVQPDQTQMVRMQRPVDPVVTPRPNMGQSLPRPYGGMMGRLGQSRMRQSQSPLLQAMGR